jgi:hypothetical protein
VHPLQDSLLMSPPKCPNLLLLLLLLLLLCCTYHMGLLDSHIVQGWSGLSLPLQPVLFVPVCLPVPDENQLSRDCHAAGR